MRGFINSKIMTQTVPGIFSMLLPGYLVCLTGTKHWNHMDERF